MPLTSDMQLISVDDHIIEKPTVWTDRLPANLRDVGPHVIELTEPHEDAKFGLHLKPGAQVWIYEDRLYPQIALNAVAGKKPEEYSIEPYRYEDIRLGCYEPKARIDDMDIAGVHGALGFPSFPRFSGTIFLEGVDKDLAKLCVRAYNDFILDEWYAFAPDRFIPLMIVPLWDIPAIVAEIERTAALGARAVSLPENPAPLGLPSYHTDAWYPVWAALQAHEMPFCIHFGSSGTVPKTSDDAPWAVGATILNINTMMALADLLFSKVFHEFPGLKVALSEGGIGWIPAFLERAENTFEKHRFYTGINLHVHPTELFRKHVYACFIDEQIGLQYRADVGIDNIMWELDYPHSDSTWPDARVRAEELFADVPDEDVRKMVETNARTLFRFPR